MSAPEVRSLQIMRAIAASLVVVAHAIERTQPWAQHSPALVFATREIAAVGVYVFFVISGFIMVHTSRDEFGRPGAALRFISKRVTRIVPIYWLATGVEIALRSLKGTAPPVDQIVKSLLFIPYAPPGGVDAMRPILGVGWTLNYEMYFYVLFACCLMFGRRIGIPLLFGTIVSLIAIGTLVKPLSDTREALTLLEFWTDPIIALFAIGAAIGFLCRDGAGSIRIALPHGIAAALALLAATFVILLGQTSVGPLPIDGKVGLGLVSAAIVAVCVCAPNYRPSPIARAGERLGDASYSLYLFHFLVIVAVEKLWLALVPGGGAAFVVFALLASLAAGLLIHLACEKPLSLSARKLATRLLDRARPARAYAIQPLEPLKIRRTHDAP